MMLPVYTHGSNFVTYHMSAAPCLSTDQQAPNIQAPIIHHLLRRRCPPAEPSDDFYGEAPPPYHALPLHDFAATRSPDAEGLRGVNYTGRRAKSESCMSPAHGHDQDFLANLAAIQLLSGSMAVPGRQSNVRYPCCGFGCDCITCVLQDFTSQRGLNAVSNHAKKPLRIQTTLHGGADGHMSLDHTDQVGRRIYHRSLPSTSSFPRTQVPAECPDRRLESIGDTLHHDSHPVQKVTTRLHNSEASRKEQSLTADGTVDALPRFHDHSHVERDFAKKGPRGILGAFRNLQHKGQSRHLRVSIPSIDSGDNSQPCGPPSEAQQSGQRSPLEDRSNMVMNHSLRDRISKRLQTRGLSSRYGDFTFDSSLRRRRRNGRHSSVCMSSAESTPLFNAPALGQEPVFIDQKPQPSSWRSAIDPLATSSIMLATVELDRLSRRQASKRVSEVLGSGQSSACGGPPNSPTMKSLVPRVIPNNYTSVGSMTSRNPPLLGISMRSGNSMSQSTRRGGRRQRKTSSRFSDIRTPENILEASDEDVSSTICTPGDSCATATPNPRSRSSYYSLGSPREITEYNCITGSQPVFALVPVDRAQEQTHLAQNDLLKVFCASTTGQRVGTPVVYNDASPHDGGQPQTSKRLSHRLHTGALTPQNTRGLWCPPRKSPSPPRRQCMREPHTPTRQSNE